MLVAQSRCLPRQPRPQQPHRVIIRQDAAARCMRNGGGATLPRALLRRQRLSCSASNSSSSNGGAASSSGEPAASASEMAVAAELQSAAAVQEASAAAHAEDEGDSQQGGSRHASSSSGGSSGHKLREQLSALASKYEALDGRMDALEGALISLLRNVKDKARRPAAAAGVGPGAEAAGADGTVGDVASPADVPAFGGRRGGTSSGEEDEELMSDSYDTESDDEHGAGIFDLRKLQSALSENINKGYLESVKHLRDMLMAYEWHLHGKELAERRGVAQFEQHCAEHDGEEVEYDVISQLYGNPNDLSVLPTNRLRLLARSIIQQAVDERYHAIYLEATATSKELAKTGLKDVIPDSAGKVGGVLKDMLPLPGFLKK